MYGRKTPSTYRSTPSVYSHYTGRSSTNLRSSKSVKSLRLPWYQKPILHDAFLLDLQRGSLLTGFLSIFIALFTFAQSIFDLYCLGMATPGAVHYGYYIFSYQFVYVGSAPVRNVLIVFSLFSWIGSVAVLITSILLIVALRKEIVNKLVLVHHHLTPDGTVVKYYTTEMKKFIKGITYNNNRIENDYNIHFKSVYGNVEETSIYVENVYNISESVKPGDLKYGGNIPSTEYRSIKNGFYKILSSNYGDVTASKAEYEKKIVPWLYTFGVFILFRTVAFIFASIVNDMIFAYNILMCLCWIVFCVAGVYGWLLVYSLYLELADLTKLEDLAHLRMGTMASLNASLAGSRPTTPHSTVSTMPASQI